MRKGGADAVIILWPVSWVAEFWGQEKKQGSLVPEGDTGMGGCARQRSVLKSSQGWRREGLPCPWLCPESAGVES